MHTVESVLRDIETRRGSEYLPTVTAEQGEYLEWLVRETAPQLVVEVGALVGYATLRVARNLPEDAHMIAIEISGDLARRAEENVAAAGMGSRVRIVRGDARHALDDVRGQVDFVLLDAERSQYLNHLKKLEPRLSPGAVVMAVGTGKGARALSSYLAHVRKNPRYRSEHKTFGDDAIEVSRFLG
jgi:predicted O-methyltransferase YrrM